MRGNPVAVRRIDEREDRGWLARFLVECNVARKSVCATLYLWLAVEVRIPIRGTAQMRAT
jgi:hypothetical protein